MDRRRPDNMNASENGVVAAGRPRRASGPIATLRMQQPTRRNVKSPHRLLRVKDWSVDTDILGGVQWQTEAFTYYRLIGQIRKVEAIKANTLSACRLRLKRLNPETGEPEDTEDPRALRVWNAFVGPHGGKRELMRKYGLLMDVAGEAFLIGVPALQSDDAKIVEDGNDSPELTWEFVSRQELRGDRPDLTGKKRGVIFRESTGVTSLATRPIPPSAYIARSWTPDPQWTELPDSSMRSVIPDAEEYVKLRDVVSGAIRQRMSAGLLLVPSSASFGAFDETMEEEGDWDDAADPLLVDLERHMAAPLVDRRDSAGYVPLIMSGDSEDLKAVRMLDLSFGNQNIEWATPLREEKLRMIGQTLDAPPETMEGKGNLNHWTGYSVDQELASKWVIPRGEQLAQFVTAQYLQPMLEVYEDMDDSESAEFVVVFDPSNITARADRGVTAIRLYDRRLLSGVATVQANGFTEDDMPDDAEMARRFLTDLVLRDPSILTEVSVAEALGLGALSVDLDALADALTRTGPMTPLQLPEVDNQGEEPVDGENDGYDPPDEIEKDDPESGGGDAPGELPDGSPLRIMNPLEQLIHDLALIADGAAETGVQRACSRLVSMSKKPGCDPAVGDRLRGRPKDQVFMLTSDEDLRRLGTTPEALMDGTWDKFGTKATLMVSRWISTHAQDAQRNHGAETTHVVDELVSRLQMQVLDTGGDRRFDGGMMVDERLVAEVIEAELGNEFVGVG